MRACAYPIIDADNLKGRHAHVARYPTAAMHHDDIWMRDRKSLTHSVLPPKHRASMMTHELLIARAFCTAERQRKDHIASHQRRNIVSTASSR